ncbi:hypothetical protein TNCV_2271781 [Trichonephila clavipes]|nr:hypothetical protein TNCV_2271781 [Trichonephila clavipes]
MTLRDGIHCCQHRATTIFRPRWRPIRLFDQPASLRYTAPISVSCSYCRRLRLEASLNIVYQSHQIRLDSRTAVLMLLNSPSWQLICDLVSLASKNQYLLPDYILAEFRDCSD